MVVHDPWIRPYFFAKRGGIVGVPLDSCEFIVGITCTIYSNYNMHEIQETLHIRQVFCHQTNK